jgi:2-iminobutanoate/2-iminopropanoate deaminase
MRNNSPAPTAAAPQQQRRGEARLARVPQYKRRNIMQNTTIHTADAPAAIGPYVQANAFGDLIFTSGQIPIDPATGEFAGATIEEQTERALKNVAAILEAAGSSMENVLKTTVFLSDIDNFAAMNAVYAGFFKKDAPPARSAVEVARLPRGALVEIEAIAFI